MCGVDEARVSAAVPVDWTALLDDLVLARGRMGVRAPEIYPTPLPHGGASAERLAAAEQRLGHPLDALHREVLTVADGWPQVFVHTDLMSTDHLGAPGLWQDTRDLIASLEEDWPRGYVPPVADLDVIGASASSTDMFLLWRTGPVTDRGHPVLWLGSGQVVERWANLADMLRAFLRYTRRTEADASAGRPPFDRR